MSTRYRIDRRTYLKTIGVGGTVVGLAGCLGGDDTIVPGTASGFPPFEYYEGEELVGFDIDLTEAVIVEAGYEVGDWLDIEFDTLIPSLLEEDIDLIAAALSVTPERQESIAFSDPYYESNQAILVRDDGFDPQSLQDLEGRMVAAQTGTTGEGVVQDELIDAGIIEEDDYRGLDNYTLAVSDLENGVVDAVVIDVPVAESFAADRDVRVAFVYETGENFAFGMRQDDDRLGDVNDGLEAVMDDGTYDELVQEYFE